MKYFLFWDIENPILVNFIEEYFKECGFETKTFPFDHFIIDINDIDNKIKIITKLNSIISNDDNIVPLSKSDAYYIDENYRYKTEFSTNELLWAIENGFAFVDKVVDENEKKIKNNNNLVCWIHVKSDGKSLNLYTLPEFRGKGIALKVNAKLTLSIIEKNIMPLCSTAYDNTISNSLIEKLGFKYSYSMEIIVI
ncbi:hypothetical protein ACTFIZ_010425 [Dictyostelium cf. discoideum]